MLACLLIVFEGRIRTPKESEYADLFLGGCLHLFGPRFSFFRMAFFDAAKKYFGFESQKKRRDLTDQIT